MKKRIVVIDDFEDSCQLMCEILSSEYECHYTCNPQNAVDLIQKIAPDLILMDYKMPHVSGVELCKIIKDIPGLRLIPIIFISGTVSSDERVESLEAGADDFIAKPFHPKELLIRAQKRLKEYSTNLDEAEFLQISNLKMNLKSRQCYVSDLEVSLAPKQFEILKLLIENKDSVISRDTFMKEIWGHSDINPRNVDSQINYLKKKIVGFLGQITAVSSHGYRIDISQ